MQRFICLVMAALLALPMTAFAAGQEDAMISELQKQIQNLSEELEELSSRLDGAERHAALDRIELTGDIRVKADSLHYKDVTFNPGINVDMTNFFDKVNAGELGAFNNFNPQFSIIGMTPSGPVFDDNIPASAGIADVNNNNSALDNMFYGLANNDREAYNQLLTAFAMGMSPGVQPFRMATAPQKYDITNDILYTTRLRLNMKANVWDNVKFSGRLSMFKNWGDSTGSKVFDSWNSFTMDGTNGGNTTGDVLRVERAYFDWSNIGDSGVYLSIGRRPSTYGPPSQFRENEMRGGTPTGHLVHFNFDGITIGYDLSELTGIEGMVARLCYGQGFESEWGNGEMFNQIETKDTHLGGLNLDILNDGTNFLQLTLFTAMDVNDGFKGIIAFPTQYGALFAPTLYKDMQKFPNFNFVTRVQPSTNIGTINLGGIGYARQEENGVNWFASAGWTQLRPNGKAGMFGGMGTDAVFQAELSADGTEVMMVPKNATDSKVQNGYGLYAGVQIPAPMGKIGFEYNYGSEYWTPFTQAQDDAIGSKLATRGHAGEAYYIVDINPRMFLKFGGIYYDYEYSGSGSPVGKPQKISDIQAGTAYSLMPVVDKAFDLNASLTMQF